MILWGTAGGIAELGEFGEMSCAACGQNTPCTEAVGYRYFHIWYLFSFITKRHYLVRCDQCETLYEADATTLKSAFPSDNIPFLRKNGALFCLTLLSVILIWTSIGEWHNAKKAVGYLATPQVNDLYLANLAAIDDSGYGLESSQLVPNAPAFGALRLERIEGDKYFFIPSDTAFEKESTLKKSLSTLTYDEINTFSRNKKNVQALFDKRLIFDIRR